MHVSPGQVRDSQASYRRSDAFLSPTDRALLAWRPFVLQTRNGGGGGTGTGGGQEVSFQGGFLDGRMPPRLGVPEVAFLGRSNVGKSSLLNRLVGRGGGRR